MYRRPRSLEVLLDIRSAMSEECGHDVRAFIEMIGSGHAPASVTRTVTREEGDLVETPQPVVVTNDERVDVTDR
jgi:hypothetical protein